MNFSLKEKNCFDPFPYMSSVDNLDKTFKDKDMYINPPFSKLKYIPDFIERNLTIYNTIYLLLPARTDTKYFHSLLNLNPYVIFLKGRLKFNDVGCAPFPTLLLMFKRAFVFPMYNFMSVSDFIRRFS